jgi:hypothetical protein
MCRPPIGECDRLARCLRAQLVVDTGITGRIVRIDIDRDDIHQIIAGVSVTSRAAVDREREQQIVKASRDNEVVLDQALEPRLLRTVEFAEAAKGDITPPGP